ncbi:hypothetical protein CBR_g24302 [Chara braunii]|uniref:K Homology domain-containing protein n=1 Tax=Chara braunii TaxID=69332 RepID=A0A388JML5_CHABU|nr:hypothetical protein CBR_g24302 [Chara braunii]|eukprot:GBG58952.1 hypothetical protein CBR_g24302 [Chara braunii]
MADETQVLVTAHLEATAASLMNENNKRRLDESGTDNLPSTTPVVDGHLYNNVAPPALSDFDLAKQKAAEIAARLCGDASVKRARTEEERDGNQVTNSTMTNGPESTVSTYGREPKLEKPGIQAANAQGQVGDVLAAFQQQNQQTQQQSQSQSQQQPQAPLSQIVLPPFFAQALSTQVKRIEVPNVKVGLVIGKGGETIKYLQTQSGARIQVTRDADADPRSNVRSIELTGTLESINRAEQLINDVIREAASGGSAVAVAKGLAGVTAGESVQIRVPNRKVGLIIGRLGETIKNLQNRSGARIQIQSDRETEPGATERIVTLFGNKAQTDLAEELMKEVISEDRSRGITPDPGYNPGHRSGSQPPSSQQQSPAWGQQQQLPGVAAPPMQQQGQQYGFQQQAQYQVPQQQYVMQQQQQPYAAYGQQQPIVRGYTPGWDGQQQFIPQQQVLPHQHPQQQVQQPQAPPSQQSGVYDYYGQSQQPVVAQGTQPVGQDLSQPVHQQMHHQVPPQVSPQLPVASQGPQQGPQQIAGQNAIQTPAPPSDGSYMYAQPQAGYYQYQHSGTPQVAQGGYGQQSYAPAQQQSYAQPQQQAYGQHAHQAYSQTPQAPYVQTQPQVYSQQQTQPQQHQQQPAAYVAPPQQTYPQQQQQPQQPPSAQQPQSYGANSYTQDQSNYYSASSYAAPADASTHTGYDYSQSMPSSTVATPVVAAQQPAVEPAQ